MKWVAFLVMATMFTVSIFLVVHLANSPPYFYSGEIVFNTEEDYMDFKRYVTDDKITIKDIDILASGPPIWVRYTIISPDAPELLPFDFNTTATGASSENAALLAFFTIASFIGTVITSVFLFLNKKEGGKDNV